MTRSITREQALGFRVRAQQLDRDRGTVADTAVLDLGVQDTGPDGGRWALAVRGVDTPAPDPGEVDTAAPGPGELSTVWTLRGAPHRYRRAELASVAAAVAPFSDADAGKRIFDASRPLKAAGIGNLAALDAVAAALRSVVTRPMVKGAVSARLTELMDPPYLRECRPCGATHLYEQTFRLAALRAGLELRAGTSPPVLEPIPGFTPAEHADERHDVIRGYLRLLGPATPKDVAGFLDSPVREVTARWPDDAVEVTVGAARAWVLAGDLDRLDQGPPRVTRLLGPFDLFLQARDRGLLVTDPARAKALWPVLGRPGGVLHDGGLVGTWRPRKSGARLGLRVELWDGGPTGLLDEVTAQAERLAAHRGARPAGVEVAG